MTWRAVLARWPDALVVAVLLGVFGRTIHLAWAEQHAAGRHPDSR